MRPLLAVAFMLFALTPVAFAQIGGGNTNSPIGGGNPVVNSGNSSGSNVTIINPLKGGGTLESFLKSILAFVVRIGTIVVIVMLIYVGYLFVAARGEPGAITKAREAFLWTIVGALILLGAQAIASGITATVDALSTGG